MTRFNEDSTKRVRELAQIDPTTLPASELLDLVHEGMELERQARALEPAPDAPQDEQA